MVLRALSSVIYLVIRYDTPTGLLLPIEKKNPCHVIQIFVLFMFYNKISAEFSIIFLPYLSYHRTYLRGNQDIIN